MPHDSKEELGLLGAIIGEPRHLFDVRPLLEDGAVFYDPRHRAIFKAILAITDRSESLRLLSLSRELKAQGKGEIFKEISPGDIERAGYAVGIETINTARYIRELYIKRLAIEKSADVQSLAFGNAPVDAVIDAARGLSEATSSGLSVGRTRSTQHILKDVFGEIEAASKRAGAVVGVDTGFSKLNRLTGGFKKNELVVLAGRPGMMKTGVGLYMAYAAAKAGVPSGWLSGEMTPEQNSRRLIAMLSGIPYSQLERGCRDGGIPFSRADWDSISTAIGQIEKLPIYFDTRPAPDINDITYLALEWQQRYGMGFLGLDYLQIFSDRQAGRTEFEQATSISKKAKQLAIRLGCPVMALSQLSRAVEGRNDRRPILSDLRQTGQIEQDADVVMGLYREDYYRSQLARAQGLSVPPECDNSLEIELLKNRSGELRMVRLWADPATNRMADERPTAF